MDRREFMSAGIPFALMELDVCGRRELRHGTRQSRPVDHQPACRQRGYQKNNQFQCVHKSLIYARGQARR